MSGETEKPSGETEEHNQSSDTSKKKKPIFRKVLIGITVLIVGFIVWPHLRQLFTQNHVQGISEAFTPMHEALGASDEPEKPYNLEETIRIIHAIEQAKSESVEFDEFLQFMASQDYSKVATDVVECQKQLLPILQELYFTRDSLAESESSWSAVKSMGGVATNVISAGVRISSGDVFGGTTQALTAAGETFDKLQKLEAKNSELKDALRSVKGDYLEYLETYTNVYLKHMGAWDKLCLHRDRAYLDIHQGRLESALISVNKALEISPQDKESLILKALCLTQASERQGLISSDLSQQPSALIEASELVNQYIEDNPSRSAPALLVRGIINWKQGNREAAFSDFDQSSIEYPRQAEQLTDMFNSYEQRAYLSKSNESHYVLELYKSSMEGFSIFSPNFHKAIIHQEDGDEHLASEEIRKHFFRRGGQVAIDYLISDVTFCNTYLQRPFAGMFREKGFVDINIEPSSSVFGAENSLNVSVVNRTDKQIKNARLFLCIHFTDMYKDDYATIKLPTTIDRLEPKENYETTVSVNYTFDGKRKDVESDIVSARAIMVTDNFISWIDGKDFKVSRAEAALNDKLTNTSTRTEIAETIRNSPISEEAAHGIISDSLTAVFHDGYLSNELVLNIPRQLAVIDPVFSIGELNSEGRVLPQEAYLAGKNIKAIFKVAKPKDGTFILHIVSSYYSAKVIIKHQDGVCKIEDISFH